ncbi:MAG: nuclear transport factor 2 family protein [Ekhidna sp.]|nr:nuclear transport factor 2 family protein [Ekhidna sp.]
MTTQEIADQLVNHLQNAQFEEAQKNLFDQNIVSIEPSASQIPTFEGLDNILKKGEEFRNSVEAWHGLSVSSPIVASNYFAIAFTVELTYKGQSEKTTMQEIIMYQIKDGKIIHEQFYY